MVDFRNPDEVREFLARADLERETFMYEQTGNPLYVWNARQTCRQGGIPTPEWIETYLDDVTTSLLNIRNSEGGVGPKRVVHALGLKTGGGPSRFKQYEKSEQRRSAIALIRAMKDRHQNKTALRRELDKIDNAESCNQLSKENADRWRECMRRFYKPKSDLEIFGDVADFLKNHWTSVKTPDAKSILNWWYDYRPSAQ